MRAMILAAGRGERLRPLTDRTPKPLIDVAGEPLIVHQLRWLQRAGIREVVINLRHLGEQIEARLGRGREWGVHITYSREDTALETGGGVLRALPLLGAAPFLVLNGDVWTDYPFARLVSATPGVPVHLVLTATPPGRDGDFGLDGDRLTRDATRPHTYCGIAVLDPALFADAPTGPFSLRELFFAAAAARRATGELWAGHWTDIGTPEQLRLLRRLTDYS